jgi:predicted porin
MKFKTTAIAMAVAGIVAAPIVVQAGADEIYASARIGIWNQETGGESELDMRSFSSRFGARGETDLGNGLTGFGRYEWDVDLGEGGGLGVRHRFVGLKGDFGSVLLGQTYHTFYNFNVGAVDSPWWHSGYNMIAYTGRTDNGITYSGGNGNFAFGVTAYMDADATRNDAAATDARAAHAASITDGAGAGEIARLDAEATAAEATASDREDGVDGIEVGASMGIGDMTLAVALQDIEVVDDAVTGISLSGIALGPVTLALNIQQNDDVDGITLNAGFGGFYLHVESTSNDVTDQDPIASTLGYTQSLGSKTTMYYEVFQFDKDTGNSDDDLTNIMAVLKYDII